MLILSHTKIFYSVNYFPFRSESPLLCKLLRTGKGGDFPDIEEQLLHYETSFDRVKAKEDGVIIPNQGVNPDYDASNKEVEEIHQDFDQYLEKQRQRLGCKVSWFGAMLLTYEVGNDL